MIKETAQFWLVVCVLVIGGIGTAVAEGVLENPAMESNASGIGVISGWYCDAEKIEIAFDDRPRKLAAYGTVRKDTEGRCGDIDNGFGLLWNYALLGKGEHRVRAYADGKEFASRNFRVGVIADKPFLWGAEGSYVLKGFPDDEAEVGVTWVQSAQNFIVTETRPTGKPEPLDGTYEMYRLSVQPWGESIIDSKQPNISVSGTMTIKGNQVVQNVSVTIDGDVFSSEIKTSFKDYGYYILATSAGSEGEVLLVERGLRLITMFYDFDSWDESVEVDYWVRVSPSSTDNVLGFQATLPESLGTRMPDDSQLGALGAENLFRSYDMISN